DNLKRAKRNAKEKKPGKEDEFLVKPTSGNKETNLEAGVENANSPGSRISKRNRIDFFIVLEGDTYRSLEKEFGMMHWELFKYNDLPEDFRLKPGIILYLQPKRNKAAVDNDFHIVEKGETMHSISQKYGIKLDKFYILNRMKAGEKPVPGSKLWLRKTRPEEENSEKEKTFKIDFDS
ncbi:MAG: LysM peptidoglycan-binding domain-containing protein, partial [Bacteroidales bacterium]|nr:LysM peptidoglycan-binding domain-containing protein [Bacteroidales bacterium]